MFSISAIRKTSPGAPGDNHRNRKARHPGCPQPAARDQAASAVSLSVTTSGWMIGNLDSARSQGFIVEPGARLTVLGVDSIDGMIEKRL